MSDLQGDLFRDEGIGRAADTQDAIDPTWSERAFAVLLALARRQSMIHIDDFLLAFPERPARPNANGAVWIRARRAGIIVPTGQLRKCRADSGKHSHLYPIYRSTVFGLAGTPTGVNAPAKPLP
jgi:hypothetical protein